MMDGFALGCNGSVVHLGECVFRGVGRFIGFHWYRAVDHILFEIYPAKST
jgi:hypothetical protein